MKKAVVGIGLLISGTIGVSTQRIVDTIFTANDWQITRGGLNLPFGISAAAIVGGVILCAMALREREG